MVLDFLLVSQKVVVAALLWIVAGLLKLKFESPEVLHVSRRIVVYLVWLNNVFDEYWPLQTCHFSGLGLG